MNYKVVVTTTDGCFAGIFGRYSDAEEFVSTVFDSAVEDNVTVIISTTEED